MRWSGGFSSENLTPILLLGCLVLLASIVAVRISRRSGLPSLLLYLGIGLLLGESGLGIRFDSETTTQALGYIALVIILTEGGLTTSWHHIKPSVAPAAVLSTVGVLVSVGVIALVARWFLHLDWSAALLVGAVLSSTDAAAVFSVLRTVPLPARLTGLLEAESGFNDAPVVILVVAFADALAHNESPSPGVLLALAGYELLVGLVVGLAVGRAVALASGVARSGSSALFSIGVITSTFLAYAVGSLLHASGFLAVYVAALVMGNSRMPHRLATRGFATALGWLAQMGLFILLGLLASPTTLLPHALQAIVLGTVLLLIARPLSVIVSLTPFRFPWREQAFLSWAGLRGAVPVVLATVPTTSGTNRLEGLFELVFMLVVIFTLVQGPTMPWVARKLGVIDVNAAQDLEVEATPLDELGADILEVRVGPESKIANLEVFELRLPEGSNVTLVVRDGRSFVPERSTLLRRGDRLLVVTPSQRREALENRLHAVSENGRLAGWVRPGTHHHDHLEQPPGSRVIPPSSS